MVLLGRAGQRINLFGQDIFVGIEVVKVKDLRLFGVNVAKGGSKNTCGLVVFGVGKKTLALSKKQGGIVRYSLYRSFCTQQSFLIICIQEGLGDVCQVRYGPVLLLRCLFGLLRYLFGIGSSFSYALFFDSFSDIPEYVLVIIPRERFRWVFIAILIIRLGIINGIAIVVRQREEGGAVIVVVVGAPAVMEAVVFFAEPVKLTVETAFFGMSEFVL